MPESYRDTIPEGVGFAPSQKYPTPVVIDVYTYPQSDPFEKQNAETQNKKYYPDHGCNILISRFN